MNNNSNFNNIGNSWSFIQNQQPSEQQMPLNSFKPNLTTVNIHNIDHQKNNTLNNNKVNNTVLMNKLNGHVSNELNNYQQQQMNFMNPQFIQILLQNQKQQMAQNDTFNQQKKRDSFSGNQYSPQPTMGYNTQYNTNNSLSLSSKQSFNPSFVSGGNVGKLSNIPPLSNFNYKDKATNVSVPIPNINATKPNKSSASSSSSSSSTSSETTKTSNQASTKYKKPNRIFIACTHCHKSKIRCLQLSEDEIAALPQEHVKHMVQLIGLPSKNNTGSNGEPVEQKKGGKFGINYPCKRCYNSNKVCVYDHSRIGRGRKPRASKKIAMQHSISTLSNESSLSTTTNNIINDNNSDFAINQPSMVNPLQEQVNLISPQDLSLLQQSYSAGKLMNIDAKGKWPFINNSILPNNLNPVQLPPLLPISPQPNFSMPLSYGNNLSPNISSNNSNMLVFQNNPTYNTIPQETEVLSSLKNNDRSSVQKLRHNDSTMENDENINSQKETKNSLSEFKVKEYITVTNIVRDDVANQLQRSSYTADLSNMINNLGKLTDEEMDMKNYDIIKLGLLTEQECARRYELFRSKMMGLPQVKCISFILTKMDWREFREKCPKLFFTVISCSSMIDTIDDKVDFDVIACYKLSEASLKMLFFYCKQKKLRTFEMFLCVNIMVIWDNIYQGIRWKDYETVLVIFKDYLNAIIEQDLPVSAFVNGDIDITVDTVIAKGLYKQSDYTNSSNSFNSVLLTNEKRLEFPALSVILELSCFHLLSFLDGSSTGTIINKLPDTPIKNPMLLGYSDSLKNSSSIYHQNLHTMASLTHFFMEAMQSNVIFKNIIFEDLKKSKYFDALIPQIETLNSYENVISVDNRRLRLCLHSMKAQMMEILIESLVLSYSKARHDPKKINEFFNSINDDDISKIDDFLHYSFDCINELDKMPDDLLIILPNCYVARISICFDMILKLLHFTLTNTKKFENINQKILEFSLKNITITYRCGQLLKKYPCNTLVQRLQTICTHAYFVEIAYWRKAISENQYNIDSNDSRLLLALKNFYAGYEACEQMTKILFKYSDSFFALLEWN